MPLKFQEKKQTEQKCINWLGLHKILDHLKKKKKQKHSNKNSQHF